MVRCLLQVNSLFRSGLNRSQCLLAIEAHGQLFGNPSRRNHLNKVLLNASVAFEKKSSWVNISIKKLSRNVTFNSRCEANHGAHSCSIFAADLHSERDQMGKICSTSQKKIKSTQQGPTCSVSPSKIRGNRRCFVLQSG
jgi:hypothetical protein